MESGCYAIVCLPSTHGNVLESAFRQLTMLGELLLVIIFRVGGHIQVYLWREMAEFIFSSFGGPDFMLRCFMEMTFPSRRMSFQAPLRNLIAFSRAILVIFYRQLVLFSKSRPSFIFLSRPPSTFRPSICRLSDPISRTEMPSTCDEFQSNLI
jgi:hypothetical protein